MSFTWIYPEEGPRIGVLVDDETGSSIALPEDKLRTAWGKIGSALEQVTTDSSELAENMD